MQRISNRNHSKKDNVVPQVQYFDRIIEVPVETIVEKQILSEPEVIEKVVEKQVQISAPPIDLQPLHNQYNNLAQALVNSHNHHANKLDEYKKIIDEQSQLILDILQKREFDRSRHLLLIKKMKKEQNKYKKLKLQMKLLISASLLLSIVSIFIKL